MWNATQLLWVQSWVVLGKIHPEGWNGGEMWLPPASAAEAAGLWPAPPASNDGNPFYQWWYLEVYEVESWPPNTLMEIGLVLLSQKSSESPNLWMAAVESRAGRSCALVGRANVHALFSCRQYSWITTAPLKQKCIPRTTPRPTR